MKYFLLVLFIVLVTIPTNKLINVMVNGEVVPIVSVDKLEIVDGKIVLKK